jgi:hypothetical protein
MPGLPLGRDPAVEMAVGRPDGSASPADENSRPSNSTTISAPIICARAVSACPGAARISLGFETLKL